MADSDDRKKRQAKRDSTEVVEHSARDDIAEKTKKLRKDASENDNDKTTQGGEIAAEPLQQQQPKTDEKSFGSLQRREDATNAAAQKANSKPLIWPETEKVVWDLESALNYLVSGNAGDEGVEVERLSEEKSVTFRVGHAGDASTMASWYKSRRHSTVGEKNESIEGDQKDLPDEQEPEEKVNADHQDAKSTAGKEEDDVPNVKESAPATSKATAALENGSAASLELWLADGMGDEQGMPPSVYALVAHVVSEKDDHAQKSAAPLAAVALMTLAWEENSRVLRVEWFQMDSKLDVADVLERKMWLRLSALSLMTGCDLYIADPSIKGLASEG